MGYEELFKVKTYLEKEIDSISKKIDSFNVYFDSIKREKQNIMNIINNKKNKVINAEALRIINNIVEKHNFPVEFDEIKYAQILGAYYLLPDNEECKKAVSTLLDPIIVELDGTLIMDKINVIHYRKILNLNTSIYESLNNLIEQNVAFGGATLNALLKFVLFIPTDFMSDEEKIQAVYQFNLANLQALQSKDKLMSSSSESDDDIVPLHKTMFEKQYSIDFEEIHKLVKSFNKIDDCLSETNKNQILSIRSQIDIEILDDDKLNELNNYINNIKSDFSSDFYIKYTYLQNVSEWYNIYLSSNNEADYISCFRELKSAVDKYQNYTENIIEDEEIENENNNELIYLQDGNGAIIGIDWINNDNHEYRPSDYSALFRGIRTIRNSDRNSLLYDTEKSKNAGIPGISEEKFRRLRKGTSRIIFMDINNMIDDSYKKYLTDMNSCYLLINFGQKAGEYDLYDSVDKNKSLKIPNLLIKYRDYLNDSLNQITSANLSFEDTKANIEKFFNDLISKSNEEFEEQIKTAKNIQNYDNSNAIERGGLNHA